MTLRDNQLFSSVAGRGAELRLFPRQEGGLKVGTLAAQAGAPTLKKGLLLAYDRSASKWTPYTQPNATVASLTLTRDAGAGDGGEFSLIIDGLAANVAWNVNTAALLAAINDMLADADKPYTVTVANSGSGTDLGTSGNVQTVTFSENAGAPTLTVDTSGLLDGPVPEPTGIIMAIVAGGTDLNGADEVRGVLYTMEDVVTSATEEVLVTVMIEGQLHRDDVNTTAMRALMGGAPSEAEVDSALRDQKVRGLSLHVLGLADVS